MNRIIIQQWTYARRKNNRQLQEQRQQARKSYVYSIDFHRGKKLVRVMIQVYVTILHYAKGEIRYCKKKGCALPKPNQKTTTIIKIVKKYAFSAELRNLTRYQNNINSGAKVGVSIKGHIISILNQFFDIILYSIFDMNMTDCCMLVHRRR